MKRSRFIELLVVAGVIVVLAVAISLFTLQQQTDHVRAISSFEECAAAGYPIMESYPEQCRTPDGRTFTRQVSTSPAVAQPIVIEGEMVCLPHRDQSGPQTLECAFGLRDASGMYYALRDSDPQYRNLSGPTGAWVQITGSFTPQEDARYQSQGVILIESLTPIE